jgi:hypothetical protein
MKKKVSTVIFNNSTKVSKTNNHLLHVPQIMECKEDRVIQM